MTLRVPSNGESRLLSFMLGKTALESFVVKLYTNNVTPGESDSAGTYTELSGSGYSSVTLTAANWTVTAGDPTSASYPQITWTFTGAAGNVYGYFVVGQSSGQLLWAERFSDGPYNVALSGDQIKVTPTITLADTLD